MNPLDAVQLAQIMPRASAAIWLDALNSAAERFQINNRNRMAAWLAQIAAESGELTDLEENLNYSAARLMQVFPREFPDLGTASAYEGSPLRIASRVYSGLYGNGDEQSCDGYTFRGRGPIQITFKDNYRDAGQGISDPLLLGSPDRMLLPGVGAACAGWFFQTRGCLSLADAANIDAISRKVNGNSVEARVQRELYFQRAMRAL